MTDAARLEADQPAAPLNPPARPSLYDRFARRLVEALEEATIVAAEDTRTTQRLLAALGIANRPRLIALHDHNEKERAPELVELAREQDVLVLSDAECGQQTLSRAGVLRGDDGRLLEGLDEPAGRVPEVSDRGRREDDHPLSLNLTG